MLPVHDPHQPAREKTTLSSVLAGVRYVWTNKLLLGATSLDLFAVLLGGATALLPIYARDILHTGPQGLGMLRAAPAAGALTMSLIARSGWLRSAARPSATPSGAVVSTAPAGLAVRNRFRGTRIT